MRNIILAGVIASIVAVGSTAHAQDGSGGNVGFGVGIETMLSGPAGPAFVYQASRFHISALLAFDTGVDENTLFTRDEVAVAGRFYYQIHQGEISDFSVGGGVGIEDDRGNDDVDIHIEGGAQIRAFIVPNVALSASLGMAFEFDDDNGNGNSDLDVALTGHLQGVFGITYFFF